MKSEHRPMLPGNVSGGGHSPEPGTERKRSSALSETVVSYLFLAPLALVLLVFSFYPVVSSFVLSLHRIVLSLHRIVLSLPGLGESWVGLANYTHFFHDPVARDSLVTTFMFVAASTGLEIVLGLCIALTVNEAFRARTLVRTAILIPWAIPTVIASQMWRFAFNDQYGLINYLVYGSHVTLYQAWLAWPWWALGAIVAADVWKTSSFTALIMLAGLQTIPDELYEAARLDGAGVFQRFSRITLPLLKPAILVALTFRTMDAFRAFDIVYVMTQGGPGDFTNVIQFYGYKSMFSEGRVGYGSAISIVTFLIVFGISLAYLKLIGSSLLGGKGQIS
jgi:multiple sugar transport system permease protein